MPCWRESWLDCLHSSITSGLQKKKQLGQIVALQKLCQQQSEKIKELESSSGDVNMMREEVDRLQAIIQQTNKKSAEIPPPESAEISPPESAEIPCQRVVTNKKVYICKCGYDAGHRKNRLTKHQQQHCKTMPRTASSDYLCPVCGITKTYDGIKSHLLQFANVNRKNQTRKDSPHAGKDAAFHSAQLNLFKLNFGPKK